MYISILFLFVYVNFKNYTMNIYTCQVQIYSKKQKWYVKIALILSLENKKTPNKLISMFIKCIFYIKIKFILR